MANIKIEIDINTDNSAFDEYSYEVHRILSQAIGNIDTLAVGNTIINKLYDFNGNHVGNIQTIIENEIAQPMPHDEAMISG